MTFAEDIEQIDSCVVYHSGPVRLSPRLLLDFCRSAQTRILSLPQDYVVEVDIVMKAETPLWKAHDVSQALQDKLEEMPRVSRCHIHVDYETTHKPCISLLFLPRDISETPSC